MATIVNVVLLFTDLVGSTELAAELSPQGADDLRAAHFSALRSAINASGGSEVKSLGDGLMVVLPSAAAALDCAVGMQQAIERHNRKAQHQLRVRVGVSPEMPRSRTATISVTVRWKQPGSAMPLKVVMSSWPMLSKR